MTRRTSAGARSWSDAPAPNDSGPGRGGAAAPPRNSRDAPSGGRRGPVRRGPVRRGLVRRALAAAGSGAVIGVLLTLAACASAGPDSRGGPSDVPRLRPATPPLAHEPERARDEFARARRLSGLGRAGEAVAVLEALVEREPGYVPAHRALQDLLVDSPADWALRTRYARLLEARPDEPLALYLAARIEPTRARQEVLVARALDADPRHPWARVAHALALHRAGDTQGAADEAREVAADAPTLALPWTFLGALELGRGRHEDAQHAFLEALARDAEDVRTVVGLVAAARDAGDPVLAARWAVEALRLAPGDAAVAEIAGEALTRAVQAAQGTDSGDSGSGTAACTAAASPAEAAALAASALAVTGDDVLAAVADAGPLHLLRARVRLALGEAEGALRDADRARASGAEPATVARVERRAWILGGEYARGVRAGIEALPPEAAAAEQLYAPRWRELQRRAAAADAARDGPTLVGLATSLVSVGWRDEAADVLADARASAPGGPWKERAASIAEQERAFDRFLGDVAEIGRVLDAAGRAGTSTPSVGDVLAAIAAASRARLGRDVTGGAVVRTYPLLGAFAASVASGGPFAHEFDDRGLFLLVGERHGSGTRIVLGRVVLVRADVAATVRGEDLTFDECWIEAEGLPAPIAGLGAGLAGLTMDRLVVLELDAVQRAAAPLPPGVELVPRPAHSDAERVALDTPSAVARRVEARLDQEGVLAEALLDAVRRHELGHVHDARRLLPVAAHPLRALSLFASSGFSPTELEARLEVRAALSALAECRRPRAALAALLGFLPEVEGGSAHARGYVEAVRDAVDEIARTPGRFPSIDPARNIVQQLDALDDDAARELGRLLLERF